MLSRGLIAGCQLISLPSSCRRTSPASSVRNRIRPRKTTRSGSFSTRRERNVASIWRKMTPCLDPSKPIFLGMRTILLLGVAALASAACPTPLPPATALPQATPLPAVSTAAMDAHLKYLADDLLEGRAPATRGGRLAANYIPAQFQALGLRPAGPHGSSFQPVALVGMTPHPSLVWGKGGTTRQLTYLDD